MLLRQLLLLLVMGTGAAVTCGAGPLFQPVSFSSHEKAGVDVIKARFYVQADPLTAWKVLSNYERIPQFVSSMKKSHVEERHANDLLLTQEAEAGFLFITKRVHVLLKVHEVPGESIFFEDVSQKDFCFYQGSWDIQTCPQGGVSVVYELEAQKKFDAPFAGDYMNGGAKDLIVAVQKEIYLQQAQINKEKGVSVMAGQTTVHLTAPPSFSHSTVN